MRLAFFALFALAACRADVTFGSAPQTFTAQLKGSSVSLSWKGIFGADGYRVMRAPAEAGPYTNISGDLTETTFVDKDTEPGASYFYHVLAFAGTTNSPESSVATVTLAPSPPSDVSAVGGTGAVTVIWTNSAFSSGVRVSRGSQTGGPYAQVGGDIGTPTVSYADMSVTVGQTYFYVLTSFNDGGESAQSTEVSAAPH